MGHDVCGFALDDEGLETEIAYLRRNASNPFSKVIYEALGAEEHYCGVSGCGNEVTFTEQHLRDALANIPPDNPDYEMERQFLRDCIEKGKGGAIIGFW
jgi:hypothetical protein